MFIRKTLLRNIATTPTTTIIVVIRDRTVTIRTNECSLRLIIAMASQTTNTGIITVAVVTTVFRYFYTPPFFKFLETKQ